MASTAATPRLTDRQIIDRYVGELHEEYAKTEPKPALSPRKTNQPVRLVAGWDGKSPLAAGDFFEVHCREITADGIAFWLKDPATQPYYVVKFAMEDETIYVKSRVTQTHADTQPDNAGYLVESRFAGRVEVRFTN